MYKFSNIITRKEDENEIKLKERQKYTGKVCKWIGVKGYGFICMKGQKNNLYVNKSNIQSKNRKNLNIGEKVTFYVKINNKTGCCKAIQVKAYAIEISDAIASHFQPGMATESGSNFSRTSSPNSSSAGMYISHASFRSSKATKNEADMQHITPPQPQMNQLDMLRNMNAIENYLELNYQLTSIYQSQFNPLNQYTLFNPTHQSEFNPPIHSNFSIQPINSTNCFQFNPLQLYPHFNGIHLSKFNPPTTKQTIISQFEQAPIVNGNYG
jgi:cold shock CspA family protein